MLSGPNTLPRVSQPRAARFAFSEASVKEGRASQPQCVYPLLFSGFFSLGRRNRPARNTPGGPFCVGTKGALLCPLKVRFPLGSRARNAVRTCALECVRNRGHRGGLVRSAARRELSPPGHVRSWRHRRAQAVALQRNNCETPRRLPRPSARFFLPAARPSGSERTAFRHCDPPSLGGVRLAAYLSRAVP